MIAAIILAAGESRRMGSPKPLLPFPNHDETFVEHLVRVFEASKANPVVVVLGHRADHVRRSADLGDARVVINERYEEGMLSSIQSGLAAIDRKEVEGALVCPVDHPDVPVEVVDRLISRFEVTRSSIVVPVSRGRRGHPVLFSRDVFSELEQAPPTVGARQVVWDHQNDLLEVKVSDPGILRDVDTPEDYLSFQRGD
jgi:molybdenum cofactor cytidylyltransferase